MLFVVWYVLLILHGPNFGYWFVLPGLVYILERVLRSKIVKYCQHGRFYLTASSLLASKVTHLVITKPGSFHFQPGDYVYLQIPEIAKYEWHPFTISSAPEQNGYFWLHIRSVGTWTNKLYYFIEERNKKKKRSVIKLQIPKDHSRFQETQELEQAAQALANDEGDVVPMATSDVHPLAPQHGYHDYNNDNATYHTQNFSHMISSPTIIDVTREEEEPGIRVRCDQKSACRIPVFVAYQSVHVLCACPRTGQHRWSLWNPKCPHLPSRACSADWCWYRSHTIRINTTEYNV